MDIDRSLFIRSNRMLGQSLVQAGLVSQEHLDEANALLIDCVREGTFRAQGLLSLLTHQLNALSETSLLHYQNSDLGLGLLELHSYALHLPAGTDPAACWATWTLPIDEREGVYFLASAYYMSPHVRSYWEQLLGQNIIWYAASQQVLIEGIEQLETMTGENA